MTRSKVTAIALFISLGVNVFLLGLFSSRLLAHPEHPHRAPALHRGDEHHPGPGHLSQPQSSQPQKAGQRDAAPPPPRPEQREADESDANPRDVRMLRQMIQIMGGRKDPRVREFWKNAKEDVRGTKQELRQARQLVQEKLIASPFVKEELEQALAALAKQTSASQSHAQTALVELASLLTDQERAQLRALPRPERRRERK